MRKIWALCAFFAVLCATALPAVADNLYRGMTLDPQIEESDIDFLGTWGPNVGRYQLFWLNDQADAADEAAYDAWLAGELDRLDTLLPAFERNGIKLVLDLHTPPGGFSSHSSPSLHRLFAESWTQRAIVEAWQTIATRYKDSSVIWSYLPVSEPAQRSVAAGLKDWNGLAKDIVTAIRAIDTTHPIIIQPIYADQAKFGRLKPIKASNIIYSFHFYYPLKFVQQGLYGNPANFEYPRNRFTKKALQKNMERAITFARKNRAKLYIGEFSCARWAPNGSAYRYLRDVIDIFEKKKWHWTYHAFREADVWSVEHTTDINDPNPSETLTDRAQLLINYFTRS